MTRRLVTVAVAAALAACLSACKNMAPGSLATGPGAGFTLTLSVTTLTAAIGTSGTLTVTGVLNAGFTDPVELTSSTTACSLSATSLTTAVTSTTVSCNSSTPGTTTVTISGLDATTGQSASAQFTLIVN
jgi:hypothetical protein